MTQELGDLIRRKRLAKGWTQSQLATKLRTTQVAVSDWETGKNQPRDTPAVLRALGITRDEYMAAVAALIESDPVARELMATTKVSAEVRNALLTLYREAVKAHRTKNDEG